ncbi:MAG: magnesium transporter, partial [Candidatus Nanoarchaeia archaeon]|nr:magnesium transporter [Candidatus Nanoarchaeia archaeon]
SDKILSVLKKDFSKNILGLSGVHDNVLEYKSASEIPFMKSIKLRLPWLVIGLLGITFAAGFINLFEEMLSEHLIIAFFIPAIVYMSGAIASQHQTLLTRDLAMMEEQIDFKKYFLNVGAVGLFLGLMIGFLIFFLISFFWHNALMALIIALSMALTLFVSSLLSVTITYGISLMKADPANGSGPFAAIVSDVSSIIIYFIIVYALISM